jgi:hypothetical protein
MSANTFWSDRMTMLMACASPGSALAYHLGLATFRPVVLRRDKTTETGAAQPAPVGETTNATPKAEPLLSIWLREGAR